MTLKKGTGRVHYLLDTLQLKAHDDRGFILVVTMFILVVLSIIGLSATRLTNIELQIAGNDRVHKRTFYQADGGTEIGMRLVYDNAICSVAKNGFTGNYNGNANTLIGTNVVVQNLTFSEVTPAMLPNIAPTDTQRHIAYYPTIDLTATGAGAHTTYDNQPNTNIIMNGRVKPTVGSGMQMVSGYEGLGAGTPQGGSETLYTIGAQHEGDLNSASLVTVQWKIAINLLNSAKASDCNF